MLVALLLSLAFCLIVFFFSFSFSFCLSFLFADLFSLYIYVYLSIYLLIHLLLPLVFSPYLFECVFLCFILFTSKLFHSTHLAEWNLPQRPPILFILTKKINRTKSFTPSLAFPIPNRARNEKKRYFLNTAIYSRLKMFIATILRLRYEQLMFIKNQKRGILLSAHATSAVPVLVCITGYYTLESCTKEERK